MSMEYDLQLFGSPTENMDNSVYWANPKWWMPLAPLHIPEGIPTRSATTPTVSLAPQNRSNISTTRNTHGLLSTLMRVFHRQRKMAADAAVTAVVGEADEGALQDGRAVSPVTTEGADVSAAGEGREEALDQCLRDGDQTEDLQDLELALAALCAKATELVETPAQEERAEDKEQDEKIQEEEDWSTIDRLSPELLPGSLDDEENELFVSCSEHNRRSVKFADDVGLPLAAVVVFEVCDEDSDETSDGFKKLKRLRRYRLTNRKRQAVPKCPAAAPAYTRYYKPYKEDYDCHRAQATGAFSMVGF